MLWILFQLLLAVWADIYMHNPRGSNNRLGETNNDQTANENRLFDSENNNNGGYVWGPPMYFIEGSILPIEWTNQHSCGGGEGKASCNVVIQYMCSRFLRDGATPSDAGAQPGTPETIPYTPGDPTDGPFDTIELEQEEDEECDDDGDYKANNQQFCYKERKRVRAPLAALMNGQPDGFDGPPGFPYGNNGWSEYTEFEYGMHESWSNYQKCYYRERNKGLFIADENVGETAVETRQEDNGRNNRHAYECTEERDYYPYWHPSDWIDIAVLTDDLSLCSYFRTESHNVKAKHECIMPGWTGTDSSHPEFRTPIGSDATPAQIPNNDRACVKAGGIWRKVPSHDVPAPECLPSQYSRDNHLGNAWHTDGLYDPTYNWTINVPERMLWSDAEPKYCALRIRYNISTSDYEGWGSDRQNAVSVEKSPITNNPRKSFGTPYDGYWDEDTFDSDSQARKTKMQLRLALNSDQYGRTFEDRSHMFRLVKRPEEIPDSAVIWNLNVRGKRGNIVQAYPGVEYDFVPNHLPASVGDYIHFQWTGGDSHPNNGNNNAEGRDNTDRSNLVILNKNKLGNNYPDQEFGEMIDLFSDDEEQAWRMALRFAHQDQRGCRDPADVDANSDNDEQNCEKLNRAARYFDGADELRNGGLYGENLVKLRDHNGGRVYHFMSSRNNNFSNRGQKGVIVVGQGQALPRWLIVIIGAVTIVGTILLVIPMVMFAPTAITAIGSSLAQRL